MQYSEEKKSRFKLISCGKNRVPVCGGRKPVDLLQFIFGLFLDRRRTDITSKMGLISRILLIYWIPIRLFLELFYAYIWTPKTKTVTKYISYANGGGKHVDEHGRSVQVDTENLNADKTAELNLKMDDWWGPTTPLLGLKAMNKVRVPIIVQAYQKDVLGRTPFDPSVLQSPNPLLGAKICEVGCGGGYLTEALVDAGADVIGIDDHEIDVLCAKTHWKETRGTDSSGPEYYYAEVKSFAEQHPQEYDVVVCSERLEHLPQPMAYLEEVMKLVTPGGVIVITTNNRTLSALLFAIIWLEHIAAIIPYGVHHLYQFIKPSDVEKTFQNNAFQTTDIIGYLPIGLTARLTWRLKWVLTSFTGVWYAAVARKIPQTQAPIRNPEPYMQTTSTYMPVAPSVQASD